MNKFSMIMIAAVLYGITLGSAWAADGGSSSAGVPNPASAWCDKNGGKLEMFNAPEGTYGICQVEQAQVEEWTFYRATGSNGTTQATQAFIAHVPFKRPRSGHIRVPNPVPGYCRFVGGSNLILAAASDGAQFGFCKFPDGSIIEEWTLFRGPDSEGYRKLGQLLGSF